VKGWVIQYVKQAVTYNSH